VPFHVQISRSFRRAREFNLSEEQLRQTILDPWGRGEAVELGDREWEPRDSRLLILEGPELSLPELGVGQGWSNAERSARDVTQERLTNAATETSRTVAILAETLTAQLSVTALLERLGLTPVDWALARAGFAPPSADGTGDRVGFALLVVEQVPPTGTWLFEAGLAIGALGRRAVAAQFGSEEPPVELQRFEVIRLAPDDASSLRALSEGLRRAGCDVEQPPG
jgi:hypothetical protein